MAADKETGRGHSELWVLAGLAFGVLGGVITYLYLRDKDHALARRCLYSGMAFTVVWAFIGLSVAEMIGEWKGGRGDHMKYHANGHGDSCPSDSHPRGEGLFYPYKDPYHDPYGKGGYPYFVPADPCMGVPTGGPIQGSIHPGWQIPEPWLRGDPSMDRPGWTDRDPDHCDEWGTCIEPGWARPGP